MTNPTTFTPDSKAREDLEKLVSEAWRRDHAEKDSKDFEPQDNEEED